VDTTIVPEIAQVSTRFVTVSVAWQTRHVPHVEIPLDGPFDLMGTLRPLVRGLGDRTIRLGTERATWTTHTPSGMATITVHQQPGLVIADAWGPGAEEVLPRLPRVLGIQPGTPTTGDLRDAPDRIVATLARRLPGIRVPCTGAVLGSLVPAILEQKVTGHEASRAWQGIVRAHGEPAPGPPTALRVGPSAATLAALPYHAWHRFGVERRRAELIRRVASRAAWFEAIGHLPMPEAYGRLTSVPGIGPWTAAEVAVRALGDVDAVSLADFHLPNLVAWAIAREPRGDDARMLQLLAPYVGRRALVIRLLESSGLRAPRYGPRLAPRRIAGI
jgi:3-methyladenine DNA glycosylase/8-oxoguanine DNA glycosylase